tara:strand:+ start:6883 stop:7755 length:873 start_codon:yes stop_codon:yes gene_type:complete
MLIRPNHKSYIGGSDAAALMGQGYKTPLQLFHEKVGKANPPDLSENIAVQLGSYLEPFVLEEAEKMLGHEIKSCGFKRHVKYKFIGGHVDGLIDWNPPPIVETKTGMSRNYKHGLPPYIEWQCRHYMMIFESPVCYVVALLLDQRKFVRFDIERNLEIEEEMLDKYLDFWRRVEEERPPAPSEPVDVDHVQLQGSAEATDEETDICLDLRDIKIQLAQINTKKEEKENQLKMALLKRGAECLTLSNNGSALLRWEEQQRTTLNQKELKKAHPEIVDQFLTTKSSRVLKVY